MKSIFHEADERLGEPAQAETDTIVLHLDDESTNFLREIYAGKGYQVVTKPCSIRALYDTVQAYPKVFMLGHGCPDGLFWREKEKDHGVRVLGKHFGPMLATKTGLYIWCHAVEYAHTYKLNGLVSGMFISEVGEASFMGITATQKQVDSSNDAFSMAVRQYLDTGGSPHEVAKCYGSADCEITKYNSDRLYVMENGVIIDSLGKELPDETSAKRGSPRFRDPAQEEYEKRERERREEWERYQQFDQEHFQQRRAPRLPHLRDVDPEWYAEVEMMYDEQDDFLDFIDELWSISPHALNALKDKKHVRRYLDTWLVYAQEGWMRRNIDRNIDQGLDWPDRY
jgi:hypothetical protein